VLGEFAPRGATLLTKRSSPAADRLLVLVKQHSRRLTQRGGSLSRAFGRLSRPA
jgi:hypothetical protein